MCIQLCRLQRAVVRLRGAGGGESQRKSPVATYLQGLVTNDMAHLHPKARSIYSLFLNSKGRVLFDSLIYSTSDPDAFLLECDHGIVDSFQKHLKMYRINRKIDVDIVDKNVWAIYDDSLENTSKLKNCNINQSEDRIDIHKDPRTNLSGMRILTTSSISDDEMIKHINDPALQKCSKVNNYVEFRYRLGIPEGKENLPSGNSFPLEANCDYLNGISFQKGCYIGQELTARTYHTGVVRKRVMPIIFNDKIDIDIPHDTPVYDTNNPTTSIGKIRGTSGNLGLGLLRINEALSASSLTILGKNAKTIKPQWWPKDK